MSQLGRGARLFFSPALFCLGSLALRFSQRLRCLQFSPPPGGLFILSLLPLGQACVEERALVLRERELGFRRPALELRQPRAGQQETGVTLGVLLLGGLARQQAQHPHIGAAGVEPFAQSLPLAQERLVRHFNRRAACKRVAVKGEQAGGAERLNDMADSRWLIANS